MWWTIGIVIFFVLLGLGWMFLRGSTSQPTPIEPVAKKVGHKSIRIGQLVMYDHKNPLYMVLDIDPETGTCLCKRITSLKKPARMTYVEVPGYRLDVIA